MFLFFRLNKKFSEVQGLDEESNSSKRSFDELSKNGEQEFSVEDEFSIHDTLKSSSRSSLNILSFEEKVDSDSYLYSLEKGDSYESQYETAEDISEVDIKNNSEKITSLLLCCKSTSQTFDKYKNFEKSLDGQDSKSKMFNDISDSESIDVDKMSAMVNNISVTELDIICDASSTYTIADTVFKNPELFSYFENSATISKEIVVSGNCSDKNLETSELDVDDYSVFEADIRVIEKDEEIDITGDWFDTNLKSSAACVNAHSLLRVTSPRLDTSIDSLNLFFSDNSYEK